MRRVFWAMSVVSSVLVFTWSTRPRTEKRVLGTWYTPYTLSTVPFRRGAIDTGEPPPVAEGPPVTESRVIPYWAARVRSLVRYDTIPTKRWRWAPGGRRPGS